MVYNWQQKDWPDFRYNLSPKVQSLLTKCIEEIGHTYGLWKGLSKEEQSLNSIDLMVVEAMKSSWIEGEYLSRQDLVSSIKNNLGLNVKKEQVLDKRAAGIAGLVVLIRKTFNEKLTEEMLFLWHKMLMLGNTTINAGQWRNRSEPMQVVSGSIGREVIHFEAPPSQQLKTEMKQFIHWFNDTSAEGQNIISNPIIRSAIAHLYFESIHPFEDGNGRIGRAISEKVLAQGFNSPILLSLSNTISNNKKVYYEALKKAQRTNEISEWIYYFIQTISEAQQQSKALIELSLKKARFFDQNRDSLNERQLKVIRKMFETFPDEFTGGMNAKKYMSINKTSKATATRDLQDLVKKSIFIPFGGGRNTHYRLNLDI